MNYPFPSLTILDHIPNGLLELEADQLCTILSGPTLIHLQGRRENPLFLSVLVHGNEQTGWLALRRLLNKYEGKTLPRALSVFIGNIDAAAQRLRHLPGQPDYNRVWDQGDTPEHQLMTEVMDEMRQRKPFASIDLHNNNGRNPHYACVTRLDPVWLQLANLFDRNVVYFTKPDSVQSNAFSSICPSVTVECGRPGEPHGIQHAFEFADACLHLSHIPNHPVTAHDMDLLHTVATVKIPDSTEFGFAVDGLPLNLHAKLDDFNFREIPAGTSLGTVSPKLKEPVIVTDHENKLVTEHFFHIVDGQLLTCRPTIPAMLTCDVEIVRQDCLCYLMERMEY